MAAVSAATASLPASGQTPGAVATAHGSTPDRRVAITIDDLPTVSRTRNDPAFQEAVTVGLLEALARHGAPAIGFVNEGKLDRDGEVDGARVDLLRRWLQAGQELGNHTYSHPDLHEVTPDSFIVDLQAGERVTRPLVEATGGALSWFRHPFLHTGRDSAQRAAVHRVLDANGYRVAPVTIDNSDYIFAAAFDGAEAAGDSALATRVRTAYLTYMQRVVEYYEEQSRALFGREIPQVLLIHANALNASALDHLLEGLRRRGYSFITLAQAVDDPAYDSPDRYFGPGGITWIHRWALTAGKRGDFFAGEPEVPAWVAEAAALP